MAIECKDFFGQEDLTGINNSRTPSGYFNMGPAFGMEDTKAEFLRKFRWIFTVEGVSAWDTPPIYSLPPRRSSLPKVSFKMKEYQHLNETFSIPVKPEWEPISLVLFSIKKCGSERKVNPVFNWIINSSNYEVGGSSFGRGLYDPQNGTWNPYVDAKIKKDANLFMLDGCGKILEHWKFENSMPEKVDFGDLEMDLNEVVTTEIVLRYDRAYQIFDR